MRLIFWKAKANFGEAEGQESLELGGKGCGKPRLHHCIPAWVTEQDSVTKKTHTQTTITYTSRKLNKPQER